MLNSWDSNCVHLYEGAPQMITPGSLTANIYKQRGPKWV